MEIDNIKKILSSPYTLPILSKISVGKIPAQIARDLNKDEQHIYYYTNLLREHGLLSKENSSGKKWIITDRGNQFLKEKLARGVAARQSSIPAIGLHNIAFKFRITAVQKDLNLRWTGIRNGVKFWREKAKDCTITLMISPHAENSVLIIHVGRILSRHAYKDVINCCNHARLYARTISERFGLGISDYPELISRPHMAFDDLIALLLSEHLTCSTETTDGFGVWTDRSTGRGELETEDVEYARAYLSMPLDVAEIKKIVTSVRDSLETSRNPPQRYLHYN